MKRFLIGFFLLAILLGIGIAVSCFFRIAHEPTAQLLEEARDAALASNWHQAESAVTQARTRWDHYHNFTASFADHAPMDEMEALFAQLQVYARQKDPVHFSALCAHLAQLAEAMAHSHCLRWWTLL